MKSCYSMYYFLCNVLLLFTSFVSHGSDRLPRIAIEQNGTIINGINKQINDMQWRDYCKQLFSTKEKRSKVTEIHLDHNNLTEKSLALMRLFENVRTITFSYNNIESLKTLIDFSKSTIETLDLSFNQLSDIDNFSYLLLLKNLQNLNISGNKIVDYMHEKKNVPNLTIQSFENQYKGTLITDEQRTIIESPEEEQREENKEDSDNIEPKETSNEDGVTFTIDGTAIEINKKALAYFPLLQELFNEFGSAKPIDITHIKQQQFSLSDLKNLINIIKVIVAKNEKDQSPVTHFKNLTQVVNNEAPKQFVACLQMVLLANYLNMQNPFFSVLVRHLKKMSITDNDLANIKNSKMVVPENISKLLTDTCVIKNKKILERHYTDKEDIENRVLSVAFDNNKTLISLLYKKHQSLGGREVNYIEKRTTDNFSPKTIIMSRAIGPIVYPVYTEGNLPLKNKPLLKFSPDNNYFGIPLTNSFKLFDTKTLYEIPFVDRTKTNQFCWANLPTPQSLAVCYKKSIGIYETGRRSVSSFFAENPDDMWLTNYKDNPFSLSQLVPVDETLSDWHSPMFNFNNKKIAAIGIKSYWNDVLAIFDTNTWQASYIHARKIFDYCFSPNNKWVAVALDDKKQKGVIIHKDFENKFLKIIPDEEMIMTFSPNSSFFAALINKGKNIVVYDTQQWNCIQVIDVQQVNEQFTTFSFSPDSNWLIVGSEYFDNTPGYTLYDTILWDRAVFIPAIDKSTYDDHHVMPFCFNKQSSNVHLCTTFCQNSAYTYGIVWNIQKILPPMFTSEKYKEMPFAGKIQEIQNHNKKNTAANDAMIKSKSNLLGLPIKLLNKYNTVSSNYLTGALSAAYFLDNNPLNVVVATWWFLDKLQKWYRY